MKLSVFLGGYKKSNHATMDSQSQHSVNIEYLKSEVGNLFNHQGYFDKRKVTGGRTANSHKTIVFYATTDKISLQTTMGQARLDRLCPMCIHDE